MARVDDYVNAKKMAAENLAAYAKEEIAARSGLHVSGNAFRIDFLNRSYIVSFPDFTFEDAKDPEQDVPIQEQVLLLHYLEAMDETPVTGRWIAYREIPGAHFYYATFVKRAIEPLKKTFGNDTVAFAVAAKALSGKKVEYGDAGSGYAFPVLPKVPLQLVLWQGDEEFAAEANILFDESVGRFLSPEDAAWLAGMLVYRLTAMAKSQWSTL